jgi:hypothetical protein
MALLQWLRNKFGFDPHLSESQVYYKLLRIAARMARKDKAFILKGGYRTLEEALYDPKNHVFILVVQGKKFKKPKALKEWFQDYKI